MTEVWFYHLEKLTLDQVLPDLLERTIARKWRAVVRAGSAERLAALDSFLWSYRDDSFLPHGQACDGAADRQPILLTTEASAPNEADILFLVDGAAPFDLGRFKRCADIFDGHDPEAVEAARQRWRAARDQGHDIAYWRQTNQGQWQRKA